MLTASRKSNGQTFAGQTSKSDGPFFCPECGSEVILRKGHIKVAHFAHKADSHCEYGAGESEQHRRCKEEIYNALSAYKSIVCEMEKGLDKVRPDIYIKSLVTGKEYAIEVQISNLTMDKIIHRTKEYYKLGVSVLWLPVLEETKALIGSRYSPKAWEKWLHSLYFGRVYYWVGGLTIQPIHFGDYHIDVPASSWYESGGYEESAGGYLKRSKRYRSPSWGAPLTFPQDFAIKARDAWFGGDISIPRSTLLMDKKPAWWKGKL